MTHLLSYLKINFFQTVSRSAISIIFFATLINIGFSQTPVPKITATKGKEFWLGFMEQPNYYVKRLDVFITSDKNTSGTLNIPGQSYSQNFSVTANQTTTVTIPNNIAEHTSTETIDNRGIVIQTQDTVSVYAINFQEYSADGTLVLPTNSNGTDYMITSYVGLSGYAMYSEALIVATQNNTQVEIIPSVNTLGGKSAGGTYTVNLNAGQSYQIKAATATTDLTGTIIRGSAQNGYCRPFAVFSGNICTNIPVGCTACDALFEQEYPTNIWGKSYMITPFSFATSYTYKVLANSNGTNFSVNGGPSQSLNSGQSYEANYVAGPVYITSNNKISVTQFMQGITCSGSGDPAQLILSPVDQVLKDITFSTVSSTVITEHNVNIIIKTAFTGQLKLDGVTVSPASFISFTPNPVYSYAQLDLTQGSHTLHADSGFVAYAYGTGSAESYAYALGSFKEETIIPTDTVYCTSTSVTLTPPEVILFPEWTTVTYPDSVIGTNQSLVVTPTGSEIYVVNGISQLTGCPFTFKFSVETPNPPNITYTVSSDTICKFESVNFNLNVTPFSSSYLYNWTPTAGLNNPYISNPVATPLQSTWYYVNVSTFSGCGSRTDSIYIFVRPGGNVSNVELNTNKTLFCLGDSAQLNLLIENIVFEDSINPNYNSSLWSSVTGGIAANTCGSGSGNAIYFNSAGNRWAATTSMNTVNGGTIYFALKIANGTPPCEGAEPGEDVVLEYSINGGSTWVVFKTYAENLYPNFTSLSIAIPAAAKTAATRFRWRQVSNSGLGQDNWALDDIYIGIKNNSSCLYTWSPTIGLSDSTITNPVAHPSLATNYMVSVIDTGSNCTYTDSVFINVGQPFTLSVSNDDTICQISGTPISAIPSLPGNYIFSWTPSSTLSDDSISSPVATPTATTTYYVNVQSIQNCFASDSVKIYVPAISLFYSTPDADSLCTGESVQIITTYQKGCGTNGSVCGGPVTTSQVGTATTTTSANNQTLYNGSSLSSRFQLLFTKAELISSGISQASTINEIGFRISSVAGSNIYQNFTIKMGCTNLTSLTSSYVPGLSTVFTPKNVIITSNIVYYVLNNTFDWDGTSNLIIEVCYNNSVTSANSTSYYSTTTFNSFLATSSASACNAATGSLSMNKPNTYFKFCSAPALNGLNFSWTPSSGLNDPNIPNPVATPNLPTIYFLSATDSATGCIYSDSVKVSVGPLFAISTADTITNCNTQGVQLSAYPSVAGNYNFIWSPSSSLNNGTIVNPIATPAATTLYKINVASEFGCTIQDSVLVIIPSLATFFATPNSDTICSGQQVQINTVFQKGCGVNGSTCTGSLVSVQLGTSATTSSANNITIYKGSVNSSKIQLLYKKSELNAAGINSASIITSLGFNISSIAGSNIYQGFSIKMACSPLANLTTTFEGGMQTVFNPKNIILSSGTNYYNFDMNFDWDGISNVIVEICYNNSVVSANSTVSYSTTAFNSVNYTTGTSVCGATTGLSSTGRANTYFKYCSAGGGGGLELQWSPSLGLNNDTIPNPIASPSISTMYTVVGTDTSTGCLFTDSVYILADANSILSLGNDTSFCSGQSVVLNSGIGFQSYLWNDGTTTSTKTVSSSGIYWVEVSGACGTQRDSVQININGNPVNFTLGPDTIICNGSQLIFNVYDSSYTAYLWNDNSTDSSKEATISGTYAVTITNQCGTSSDSVIVLIQDSVPVNLGNDSTICSGNSLLLVAGNNFSTYLWQDGSSLQTYSVQTSGAYFVEVTNACGNSSDTILINFLSPPIPVISSDTISICSGDSALVFVNSCSGCSFLWDNNSVDTLTYYFDSGFHFVLVSNFCGNSKDSFLIYLENSNNINLGNDLSLCSGDSILLNAGAGYNNYLWQDGSSNQTFLVKTGGIYFVSVSNNCTISSDTILVNFSSLPTADLGTDTTICSGDTILLSVKNCPNCSYYWQDGSANPDFIVTTDGSYFVNVNNQCGFTSDVINIFFNPLPSVFLGNDTAFCSNGIGVFLDAFNSSSTYLWNNGSTGSSMNVFTGGVYWVEVTNDCGTSGDTIQVSITPIPEVNLGNDKFICIGDSFILSAGASPGIQCLWQDGSTSQTFSVTKGGLYWVISSNSCGTDADSIFISEENYPVINLGNDKSICAGSSSIINAGNNIYSYLWNTGSPDSSIVVDSAGTYWAMATNNCGTVSDTVKVTVNPLPLVNLGNDSMICLSDTLFLDASQPGCFYLWQNNSTQSEFNVLSGGIYWVELTNGYGCKSRDSLFISAGSKPLITLGNDTAICPEDEMMLDLSGFNYLYQWQDGSNGTSFLVKNPGWYSVRATNYCGSFSDSIQIKNLDCNCHVDVPSAFSPNGDAANDVLYLRGNCVTEINFYVYDRWGQLVFESHDLSFGWDGNFKGKKMDAAVFVYFLNAKSVYDEETEFIKKGNISLVR